MLTEMMHSSPKNWRNLEPHAYSALVDYGIGIDLPGLAESMKANGYDEGEPIVIFQGKILDGRHRLSGAIQADIVPPFRLFIGTEKQALAYAQKKLYRQHLTTVQRAFLASGMAKLPKGSNQHTKPKEDTAVAVCSTVSEAAKAVGVSEDSVSRAKAIEENGTPKLKEEVLSGKKSLSQGAKEARKKKPKKPTPEVNGKSDADESRNVLLDDEYHVVPESCHEAFANLEKFKALDSHLQAAQKLIDEISTLPGGEQLRRCLQPTTSGEKTINKSQHMNDLKRDVKHTRPHSVCPWCKGKGEKGCRGCQGTAWVTSMTWKGAEDQIKDRLK